MTEEFIGTMEDLCGHQEIYNELSKYAYKFISCEDGKQYPTDDNYSSSVDDVELTNQLALSL